MGTRFHAVFFFLLGALFVALPTYGQTFGQITGLITDSTGGVMVGAAVTVVNPQTNFTRTENTSGSGLYSFPNLLPGIYNVRVSAAGFQSVIRNDFELQVEQRQEVQQRRDHEQGGAAEL